jgi:hypothetical protein
MFQKHYAPPWDVIAMEPHRSMCTSPRISLHEKHHSKEMPRVWWCLPYTHLLQKFKSRSPLLSTRLFLSMVVKAYIETCPNF